MCSFSAFCNVSCWLQCDLAMDDFDPEPLNNTEIGEGSPCFSAVHPGGGGKEWSGRAFVTAVFWKCVQRSILEDEGEGVPTICTALPKHCALVWGNRCGLWRYYENIGLLGWLQKKSQLRGNVFVIFYWSETWKIQHSLESPWNDFMFREWRSNCETLKWVYMTSVKE